MRNGNKSKKKANFFRDIKKNTLIENTEGVIQKKERTFRGENKNSTQQQKEMAVNVGEIYIVDKIENE